MFLSVVRGRKKKMRPREIVTSLFSKLLLIILLTGFFINLLVAGFFIHVLHKTARQSYLKNVINYANYLIEDIGIPPSFERAEEISREYLIHIAYESPEVSWATSEDAFQITTHHWRTVYEGKGTLIRRSRGRNLVSVGHKYGRFTFILGKDIGSAAGDYSRIAILILLLTTLLCLAYFAIRYLLKPIKWLQEGVKEVGKGNLEHSVPEGRSSELGHLAKAFNEMTGRIRDMLKDREQLLLDVSHELRTPLTRMKVALEFVPEGRAGDSIREDAREMESMITAILEEARLRNAAGRIEKRKVSLNNFLQEVVKDYANRSPDLEVIIPDKDIVLEVEPELVKIALRNVLNNAFKYSGSGVPPIKVELAEIKNHIMVIVSDKGIGIPEDDLPHIFEPFYRVDKSRSRRTGGYGIGLSLCKTIMDAHGGDIKVESLPGKGTTMKMIFPGKK
jgi:signal transduction histidine kinase